VYYLAHIFVLKLSLYLEGKCVKRILLKCLERKNWRVGFLRVCSRVFNMEEEAVHWKISSFTSTNVKLLYICIGNYVNVYKTKHKC